MLEDNNVNHRAGPCKIDEAWDVRAFRLIFSLSTPIPRLIPAQVGTPQGESLCFSFAFKTQLSTKDSSLSK